MKPLPRNDLENKNERDGKASDWVERGKRLNHEKGIDNKNENEKNGLTNRFSCQSEIFKSSWEKIKSLK